MTTKHGIPDKAQPVSPVALRSFLKTRLAVETSVLDPADAGELARVLTDQLTEAFSITHINAE